MDKVKQFLRTVGSNKARLALGIAGIIFGLVTVILGITLLNADYGNWQSMSVSFGGDFYTYSYEATAQAANNVLAMAKILRNGLAYVLMTLGAFELLLFGNLALKTLDFPDVQACEVADAPIPEVPEQEPGQEEAPTDEKEETP